MLINFMLFDEQGNILCVTDKWPVVHAVVNRYAKAGVEITIEVFKSNDVNGTEPLT